MYGDTIKHWISIPVSFPFNARNKLDKKKENPCVMTCFDVPQLSNSICVKIKHEDPDVGTQDLKSMKNSPMAKIKRPI